MLARIWGGEFRFPKRTQFAASFQRDSLQGALRVNRSGIRLPNTSLNILIDTKRKAKTVECMISVKWEKNRYPVRLELPKGWAFFRFLGGEQVLFCGYTPNLAQRLETIKRKAEQDALYAGMSESADTLEFEACPRAIDALIRSKIEVQKNHPQYQNALNPTVDYVYLALDARRFPFVSIQSHTNDDWIYVGPWRSRFSLVDVLDSVSRILKIPFCETRTYPCEKLDKGICNGYCLALEEENRDPQAPDLAKLEALLKEAYLHPENGILNMVTKERDNYFNDLEFAKADLLDDEIENLAGYKDWLNFLYVTKALSFQNAECRVEQGLLTWCKWQGREYEFPLIKTEYRDNELLALNLDAVDEARIIYDYHLKTSKG